MGCSGSKSDDLPLVIRCRERRDLIRDASNHRYALAAAHVSYFRSLKNVGDALTKFVDQELLLSNNNSEDSSSVSSPSLLLPPGSKKTRTSSNNKEFSDEESSLHLHNDDDDGHIISSDSDSDSEDLHNHNHNNDDNDNHRHNVGNDSTFYHPRGGGGGANFSNNGYGYGYGQGFGNVGMSNDYPYNTNMYSNSYNQPPPYLDQWGQQMQQPPWFYPNYSNSNVFYMKKSAPESRTYIQQPPVEPSYGYSDSYWTSPSASYNNNNNNNNVAGGGYSYGGSGYGYSGNNEVGKVEKPKEPPPMPSPPKSSGWDFTHFFDVGDYGYPSYDYTNNGSSGRYVYGSVASSPDSTEVREREGIPELEEETESEVLKEVVKGKGKRMNGEVRKKKKKSGESSSPLSRPASAAASMVENHEGGSRAVPMNRNDGGSRQEDVYRSEGSSKSGAMHNLSESSSRSLPSWSSEEIEKPSSMPPPEQYNGDSVKTSSIPPGYDEDSEKPSTSRPYSDGSSWVNHSEHVEVGSSISLSDEKSSGEHVVSKSVDEVSVKKRGVTFDVEESSKQDGDSSKLSSVTLLAPHGTRDLREVVAEIRDDFETASSYGIEVATMLEVGKLPYQPSFLKVIISRILYLISPSMALYEPPSKQSVKLASKTVKLAKSYFEDVGNDVNAQACNLSSTMDKLYEWEKKLYKEVKDEERLRVIYEKQCKRLKSLDEEGAESGKIDATRASIRRLVTKLDVSIRRIDAISSRIHKLRDDELQPQVAVLIHGLIRMWKAMLKCHQKQFQAIMESKMRKLKANTGHQIDTTSRASTELERELRAWCDRFNDWIRFQKSYVESLNGWLLHCLQYEPEETPDGPVPYSPGRLGAPPIFIISNDWHQAMEAISEARVANAMNTFATSLRQLWEKQDEEGRQRLKAEYLSKDYEKHLKEKMGIEKDTKSNKTGLSVVQSDSGVSPLDDLKVDLDSMRQRLAEERTKHRDAMKLVHDAASSSLQGGLVPIFKALENFTKDALKAHEHVRLQHPVQSL